MSTVPYLPKGQALALDYQTGYLEPPTNDLDIVAAAIVSPNAVYGAAIAVDGSFNIYGGRLPDALRGSMWRSPPESQRTTTPKIKMGGNGGGATEVKFPHPITSADVITGDIANSVLFLPGKRPDDLAVRHQHRGKSDHRVA
jgi:hypothetical protein